MLLYLFLIVPYVIQLSLDVFPQLQVMASSDEVAALCDNCSKDYLFKCQWSGQPFCLFETEYLCNGQIDCDDGSDESPSVCGTFKCPKNGEIISLKKSIQCDGVAHCDDGSDEVTSLCDVTQRGNDNCNDPEK